MKSYSTKILTVEKEVKNLIKVSCDICGKESNDDDWTETHQDKEINHDIEVSMTVTTQDGDFYWAEFSTEDLNMDVCPECFINEILALKNKHKK